MPEGFIQVAPSGTGPKLRTRERTIGANTVQEQYVIPTTERNVLSRSWYCSLRCLSRASTAQPLFSVYNTDTDPMAIRRLSLEVDSIAASAVASPYARLYRVTAAPTGGTVLTANQQDTADPAIAAGLVVRADHQGDGVVATTPLAATPNPAAPMWAQTIPRWQTLAGWQSLPELNLTPDDDSLNAEDPLILRTNQGLLVRLEAAAAMASAAFSIVVKCVVGEFTLP